MRVEREERREKRKERGEGRQNKRKRNRDLILIDFVNSAVRSRGGEVEDRER